jgi:hypothetical protein
LVAELEEKHDVSRLRLGEVTMNTPRNGDVGDVLDDDDGQGFWAERCCIRTQIEVIAYIKLQALLPDAAAGEGWEAKLRPTYNESTRIFVRHV